MKKEIAEWVQSVKAAFSILYADVPYETPEQAELED